MMVAPLSISGRPGDLPLKEQALKELSLVTFAGQPSVTCVSQGYLRTWPWKFLDTRPELSLSGTTLYPTVTLKQAAEKMENRLTASLKSIKEEEQNAASQRVQ
jgi:hypothetical protein